jgi:hypothetical protein
MFVNEHVATGMDSYGWLLLTAGDVFLLFAFTHFPAVDHDLVNSLLLDARGAIGRARSSGARQLRDPAGRSRVLEGLVNNLWFALAPSRSPSRLPSPWRSGSMESGCRRGFVRMAYFTPTGPAADRRRQYLDVLLHAGFRPDRSDHRALFGGRPRSNWLGDPDTALNAVMS